jgi:hypothetical protein
MIQTVARPESAPSRRESLKDSLIITVGSILLLVMLLF